MINKSTKRHVMSALIIVFLTIPTFVRAGEQQNETYVLYTETYGRDVKFTRNLTKQECEFAMNRALGQPATPEEKEAARKKAEESAAKAKQERENREAYCREHPEERPQPTSPGVHAQDGPGSALSLSDLYVSGTSTASYISRPGNLTFTTPASAIAHAECFRKGE